MRPLTLGAVFLSVLTIASQEPIEKLEHILVYPAEPATSKSKRDVTSGKNRQSDFNEFVEEKLIQHTQALEYLVQLLQSTEETTKQLVDALSRNIPQPELPEKIEVQSTRSSSVEYEMEHPIVRFAKSIPKIGLLIKHLIMADLNTDEEPLTVVEYRVSDPEFRRGYDSKPVLVPKSQSVNKPSPWCSLALLCRRTMNPVCGYDDNFGYGKFDDICHMLQVNCYWKYNFSLVPQCRPGL